MTSTTPPCVVPLGRERPCAPTTPLSLKISLQAGRAQCRVETKSDGHEISPPNLVVSGNDISNRAKKSLHNLDCWQRRATQVLLLESVKSRFSNCHFSAELEKYLRWGQHQKMNPKKPWASIFTLSPCGNRCHFSESAFFLFAGAPPIENKFVTKVASG